MEQNFGTQDKNNRKIQKWIYMYELIGSAFLMFAYNIAVSTKEMKEDKEEEQISMLTETIVYGGSYALISLLFGSLSNGGYFNPAVVIAMLI